MSALPKAVQKQVEEANRLAEQLAKEREAPPANDEQLPEAQQAPPTAEAQPEAPPQEPKAEEAPSKPPVEPWEQKYRVLQGKYNAEVPRLQRTVQEQTEQVRLLQQQLTATQGMISAMGQRQQAAPAQQAPQRLVKPEEVNEFGEDLTDFIRRVAQEALNPTIEDRVKKVQQMVDQVRSSTQDFGKRIEMTDRERMLATLDAQVPNWRELNNDDGFLAWLEQVDPYVGQPRMELLKGAYERHDGMRVAAFFKGYKSENAVVTPPAPAAPAPQKQEPQRKLDQFVAPGTPKQTGATGAQSGPEKRIWTEAQIKQFYTDAAAGKFAKNPDRRNEIERQIHEAVREGRVR